MGPTWRKATEACLGRVYIVLRPFYLVLCFRPPEESCFAAIPSMLQPCHRSTKWSLPKPLQPWPERSFLCLSQPSQVFLSQWRKTNKIIFDGFFYLVWYFTWFLNSQHPPTCLSSTEKTWNSVLDVGNGVSQDYCILNCMLSWRKRKPEEIIYLKWFQYNNRNN